MDVYRHSLEVNVVHVEYGGPSEGRAVVGEGVQDGGGCGRIQGGVERHGQTPHGVVREGGVELGQRRVETDDLTSVFLQEHPRCLHGE